MTNNQNDAPNAQNKKILAVAQQNAERRDGNLRPLSQATPANGSTSERVMTDIDTKIDTESKDGLTKSAEPQMKKVDIVIAGVTYSVLCPIDEESELRSAVYYINDFVINIKRDSPNLKQENLLVLTCLNLFEQINSTKKSDTQRMQQNKQSETLLNKIIKDAESIL